MKRSSSTRLAGVLGWPVGHSRSPRLHGYWLRHYGIDGAYVPLPVQPEDLADAVRLLPRMGFVGANVTVPHKEAAFRLATVRDAAAERCGAVNTLVFTGEEIEGRNTDVYGFMQNLQRGAPHWRADDGPAVLLGAGGAARAVAVGLLNAGVPELRILNRTQARAETLAAAVGSPARALPWHDLGRALDGAALLVNATSLGMTGQDRLAIDLAPLPNFATVTDIVYAPLETELLAAARQRGLATVDGLGMLLYQAQPGFAAWFGTQPEVTPELRRAVLEAE
jgi:shikimate dehydrogenase